LGFELQATTVVSFLMKSRPLLSEIERRDHGTLVLYTGQLVDAQTRGKGDFSLYVRAYGPKTPITDGSWTPPSVDKVK